MNLRRLGVVIGTAALIGGCGFPIAIGGATLGSGLGGYALGSLSDPVNDYNKANTVLKLDAPIKKLDCVLFAEVVAKNPGLQTYCNHIPQDILSGIDTWGLVFEAMKTGKPQ